MKKIKILKGWHYAFIFLTRFGGWYKNKKNFIFKIKLDESCWWDPPRNIDDYDLNKLLGISFGVFGIHKNSVRLAWRPDFNERGKIEIHSYVYDDTIKATIKRYITTISVNKEYVVKFKLTGTQYIINFNGLAIVVENPSPDKKLQKIVYPYFGGNNKAPQTMIFYMGYEAH